MNADIKDRREASGLALPVSVAVHAVLVLLLVFGLPFPQLREPEEEQAIAVDLVPPPEDEQQAQAEPPPSPAPEQPEPEPPEPEQPEPEPEPPPSDQAAQQTPPPQSVLQPVFRFGEREDGARVTVGDAAEEAPPAEEEEAQQAEPQAPEAPVQPETLAAEQLASQSEQQEAAPPTPTPRPEPEGAAQVEQAPAAEDAGRLASRAESGVTIATTAMNDLPRGVRAGRLCVTALRERMLNSVPPYFPDLLPSHRLDVGTVLVARRAAFRMGGDWFGLSYRCEIDEDATRVRSFAFEVGERLSQAERQRRGLPLR